MSDQEKEYWLDNTAVLTVDYDEGDVSSYRGMILKCGSAVIHLSGVDPTDAFSIASIILEATGVFGIISMDVAKYIRDGGEIDHPGMPELPEESEREDNE